MKGQVKKTGDKAVKTSSAHRKPSHGGLTIRITRSGKTVSRVVVKGPQTYFLKVDFVRNNENLKFSELTYAEISPIVKFFDYKQKDVAEFLDVDESTVSRWKTKGADIGSLRTKAIVDIDGIIAKGVRVFGSEDSFKDWLNSSNYSLGDQKPIELLKNPYGVEMVEEAIDGLSWGAYI